MLTETELLNLAALLLAGALAITGAILYLAAAVGADIERSVERSFDEERL